jgi:hypothetical protein
MHVRVLDSYVWGYRIESWSSHFVLLYAAAMLLVALYEELLAGTKVVYFSKIYYRTSLYDPVVSGTSVAPTSQVRSPSVLVLPIVEN